MQLRERLADPRHTQREIAHLILHEPALTARVLRIVNSAYYGLPQQVSEISHALNILGEEELQNLVLVTSLVKTMNQVSTTVNLETFWRASIFNAVLARNLAQQLGHPNISLEDYFISGLLLDIGRLLLYHHEPALLDDVKQKMIDQNQPDYVVERDIFGFDHADVGALMASSWNLSGALVENILCHHRPIEELSKVNHAVMSMTAFFSDKFDFMKPGQVELESLRHEREPLLRLIGMDWTEFCVVVNNSYEDYLHAHEAFLGASSGIRGS